MHDDKKYKVVLLPGDGIGPEVVREAMRVLEGAGEAFAFALETETRLIGGAAIDAEGDPLPEATREAAASADAVLLGAVGGPKWDHEEAHRRPESGLLALRRLLGTYANLRPVRVPPALAMRSPLRSEVVSGTDLLIVRELTGGIYFGEPKGRSDENGRPVAYNTMRYGDDEVIRVARVAFDWAARRSGRVTSVDKANVLEVSRLWREIVSRIQRDEYPHVELNHLYVDNAAMQIVRDPRQFDVVLTGNLFGDILSDLAATLPGSLGLLPSASVGGQVGLFEPVHGSAPDIAGKDVANPLAAISSASMMLDHLGETAAAAAVREAVEAVLESGLRSADLCGDGEEPAATSEIGTFVADHVKQARVQVTA